MTKLLEQVFAEASKLPTERQDEVAQRWLRELRSSQPERQRAVDELLQLFDAAAALARPEAGWRFSREETYRDRVDRFR